MQWQWQLTVAVYQLKNAAPQQASVAPDYFFVNVEYSLFKINRSDITWVEGLKDYIKIHLKSSTKPVITRMPMKSIEDELPASAFIRIHKSFIVSIEAITAVRKTSVFVGLMELPVGDNYRQAINALTGKS